MTKCLSNVKCQEEKTLSPVFSYLAQTLFIWALRLDDTAIFS